MKSLIRIFIINAAGLWLATILIPGITYEGGVQTLFIAAAALGGINLVVRPLAQILFLPINLITHGLLAWVINVAMLYLLTFLLPQFKITSFYFPGFQSDLFIIPAMTIEQFWTAVLASILISFVGTFFNWLSR